MGIHNVHRSPMIAMQDAGMQRFNDLEKMQQNLVLVEVNRVAKDKGFSSERDMKERKEYLYRTGGMGVNQPGI